eukprot:jgi/Bigna1/125538/aug1.1_g246
MMDYNQTNCAAAAAAAAGGGGGEGGGGGIGGGKGRALWTGSSNSLVVARQERGVVFMDVNLLGRSGEDDDDQKSARRIEDDDSEETPDSNGLRGNVTPPEIRIIDRYR